MKSTLYFLTAIALVSPTKAAVLLTNDYDDNNNSLLSYTVAGPAGSGNIANVSRSSGNGIGGSSALRFDIVSAPTVSDGFIIGGFSNLRLDLDPEIEEGSITHADIDRLRISFLVNVPTGTEISSFRVRGSGENSFFIPNQSYSNTAGYTTIQLSGEDLLDGQVDTMVSSMNAENNVFMTFSFNFTDGTRTDDDFVLFDNFRVETIPEPTSLFLSLSGILLGLRRRR